MIIFRGEGVGGRCGGGGRRRGVDEDTRMSVEEDGLTVNTNRESNREVKM